MLSISKRLKQTWFVNLIAINNASYSTQWNDEVKQDTISHPVEDVFKSGVMHHHICNTAFPIAHTTTIKPYRVPRHRDQIALRNSLLQSYGNLNEMMMYAHIPFCHTRCQFCEYTVIDPIDGRNDNMQTLYFNRLLKEFDLYSQLIDTKNKKLTGFDIGGGTPSMASIDNIYRLFDAVTNGFQCNDDLEISIETTPVIAANEPEKIKSYKQMGINRISFGLQTTDFSLAKKLGRNDNNNFVNKAVNNIRNAGFNSMNIDLMYGFPIRDGTKDKWAQTVLDCINLEPEHITLYRMRYKGTKMSHLSPRVELDQINNQELEARLLLNESGYKGWIGKNTYSNILDGRNGCSDYLNNRVMNGIPYIGIGLGAQSFSHNSLHYNLGAITKKMSQYLKSCDLNRIPIQDLYYLSKRASAAKFISVSFYFGGIDLYVFESIFNVSLESMYYNQVQFVLNEGLMSYEYPNMNNNYINKRLQMTVKGKKNFGGICALFYTPNIQSYLLGLSTNTTDKNNMQTKKVNSVHEKYEFGNILFGGECNQNCYFCIGKQLNSSLSPENKKRFPPKNMEKYMEILQETNTKKIILSGTTSDPLLYKYNKELIKLLKNSIDEVHISIHSNGEFIIPKLDVINCCDSITISYNSFDPKTFEKIHGTKKMPNLKQIVEKVTIPIKLSCILTQENMNEIVDYIYNCSKLGIKRIAFRHLFEVKDKKAKYLHLFSDLFSGLQPFGYHCNNPIYYINGIEVTHWIFENTSGKSLNLFANGQISHHYLLSDAEISQSDGESILYHQMSIPNSTNMHSMQTY